MRPSLLSRAHAPHLQVPVHVVLVVGVKGALGLTLEGVRGGLEGLSQGGLQVLDGVLSCKRPAGSLHVGVVLLQDVLVGRSVLKEAVTLANAGVFCLCGACPVDVEVCWSFHVVLVHCGDPLIGACRPCLMHKNHLGAALVDSALLHLINL